MKTLPANEWDAYDNFVTSRRGEQKKRGQTLSLHGKAA
jgi:hypothetical protein